MSGTLLQWDSLLLCRPVLSCSRGCVLFTGSKHGTDSLLLSLLLVLLLCMLMGMLMVMVEVVVSVGWKDVVLVVVVVGRRWKAVMVVVVEVMMLVVMLVMLVVTPLYLDLALGLFCFHLTLNSVQGAFLFFLFGLAILVQAKRIHFLRFLLCR